jgi:NAD(P)-dependent dehydrogenase (short-subunit alcohol dehydrogenase family)
MITSRVIVVRCHQGVMMESGTSADGYELHFAVNHLGHFLFTHLLLDLMKQASSARIINVSSINHRCMCASFYIAYFTDVCSNFQRLVFTDRINWNDIHLDKSEWKMYAYSHSKLMNILFTYELARRLQGSIVY